LFGSDGPWLHPGVELAKVRALEVSASARALILGGNLLRLIGAARDLDRSMWSPAQHQRAVAMAFERV